MKILLAAVNASYMHTNIAVRSLKAYAEKNISDKIKNVEIHIQEYTINQPAGEVLRGIAELNPQIILFSTYIWNAQFINGIIPDVKKLLPSSIIGAGGPEYSYASEKYLKALPELDFILNGEGEKTFTELIEVLNSNESVLNSMGKNLNFKTTFKNIISNIKGISFLKELNLNSCSSSFSSVEENLKKAEIIFTGNRELISSLDELEFPYPELLTQSFDPDHKIYYYESSRGCPFSCSYCLSSVDKNVRFKSLELVKSELKIFLDANVKLVKFVDRTYNLKSERYIEIWKYILNNHNGKTMFHFEIEAEFLSEEALNFLQKIPAGIMQFEIGVQSANKKTLEAINRSTNIEALAKNIKCLPSTIHQHLDLIAGLPYEDLESFGKSYNFVMSLKPDALQLGFLKVLSGTQMEKFAKENNWQWMTNPVYETFSTPYLSFQNMMFLKDIEVLTDNFWNKHLFDNSMNYIFSILSPWSFFNKLHEFCKKQNSFSQARKDSYWFEIFASFIQETNLNFNQNISDTKNLNTELLSDYLKYDFILTGKKGNFPDWYKHVYSKEEHLKLLDQKGLLHNNRLAFATTEYEVFSYDIEIQNPQEKGYFPKLIEYKAGKK